MTFRDALTSFTARLTAAGADSPRLSAEVLLAFAMDAERDDLLKTLLLFPEKEAGEDTLLRAESFVRRREAGEPVAYITGAKEFYGRDFAVTPATLIPRPDTETLVEAALSFARSYQPCRQPSFIDLGTGSGAIAVTLALELPAWRGTGIDISPGALSVAKRNATALGADNLEFALRDFLGPDILRGSHDMVLANPPYVSEREYRILSPEVANFEPKSALVPDEADPDGTAHLFALLGVAERILVPGGLLLMEMGCTQGTALMERTGVSSAWENCRIIHDLAGLPRVFHAVLS